MHSLGNNKFAYKNVCAYIREKVVNSSVRFNPDLSQRIAQEMIVNSSSKRRGVKAAKLQRKTPSRRRRRRRRSRIGAFFHLLQSKTKKRHPLYTTSSQ